MTIKDSFTKKIRVLMRTALNKKNRQNLVNTDFSLISANCIGGVISHELGLQFLSPTVNLFMSGKDFVKFCSDLKHYTSCNLEYIGKSEQGIMDGNFRPTGLERGGLVSGIMEERSDGRGGVSAG